MEEPSEARLVEVAADTAREAGALLRQRFAGPRGIRTKSAAVDLVTDADHASDELIRGALRAAFPAHWILSEEAGPLSSGPEEPIPFAWIVDPLDGTVNFAHGVPHFAVSIAVLRGLRPEDSIEAPPAGASVVAGAIYDPMRDELFTATADGPALRNGERIRTSATTEIGEALVATGFPYDRREQPDAYLRFFREGLVRCRDLRRIGAAALDLSWVACGRLDGFYECGLHAWDIAAGALIARRAGAVATDFLGEPLLLDARRVLVAPFAVHARLREALAVLPRARP
jgi:myo-inositol-1(or 4)-monophosphatase